MMMSQSSGKTNVLTCALTGTSPIVEPVVTPSGHICERRLLVSQLLETRHMDPFQPNIGLEESELISLAPPSSAMMPPRVQSDMPGLLQCVQKEFDAILLELYDTRRALEDTRKELSVALYQNDAAVRVVARVVAERDAARQNLASAQPDDTNKRPRVEPDDDATMQAPPPKKQQQPSPAVVEPDAQLPLVDEKKKAIIPAEHLRAMEDKWKLLSKSRKKRSFSPQHATIDLLHTFASTGTTHELHSNDSGIVALTKHDRFMVTIGTDDSIVVYDSTTDAVLTTIPNSNDMNHHVRLLTTVDILQKDDETLMVVTGGIDGLVHLYFTTTTTTTTSDNDDQLSNPVSILNTNDESSPSPDAILGVSLQPTGHYILVLTKSGKVHFIHISSSSSNHDNNNKLQVLATFQHEEDHHGGIDYYTCAGLHPDGLIYGVGTMDGKINIWDLKSQRLASTLEGESNSSITALAFSENGYHFASAAANGTVSIWDLRKLKTIATLGNSDESSPHSSGTTIIRALSFDPSGKFLAYAAGGIITLVVVKESDKTVTLSSFEEGKKQQTVTGIAWGEHAQSLITASETENYVRVWGVPPAKDP